MKYSAERDAASEAAKRAAVGIRKAVGKLSSNEISNKGTHDLVTVADLNAQKAIISFLSDAFPDYGFLAEEESDESRTHSNNGYTWIIDPIDGTTNFTHGLPPFAVSIGLKKADEIIVGVVLEVASNELFTATRGGGSFLNGNRISVSEENDLDRALVTTGFPYREFHYLDEYMRVLAEMMRKTQGVRRPGASSVDLAYLAAGRFDAFFELGLSPWDVAAGTLLVEEAGGRVSDFYAENNFLFGGQLLATNGKLHAIMLDMVTSLKPFATNRQI